MNAIDVLTQLVYENCGPERENETHEGCARIREALAAVEELHRAAEARLAKGHNDTCSYVLDDDAHSNGYECDCWHGGLAAAVRRVNGENT